MNQHLRQNTQGQSMVEFVLILFVVMILCSGMIYTSRLLTFDYWAQQEARYIAFEQTWVPAMANVDPFVGLDNGTKLRRPKVVERIQGDASKTTSDEGDIIELLSSLVTWPARAGEQGSDTTLFAKAEPRPSLLQAGLKRTKTGFDTIKESVVVQSAYANLVSGDRTMLGGAVKERPKQRTQLSVWDPTIRNDMERSIVTLLDRGEFGPRFCTVMQAIAQKHAHQKLEEHFSDKSCASRYTKSFGLYLARTTDPRQVFRDMELQLESGFTAPTAVTAAIETNIARGFYSFFDTLVNTSHFTAIGVIAAKKVTVGALAFEDEIQDLLTEMRYVGSNVAMSAIAVTAVGSIIGQGLTRDWEAEKAFEDIVNSVLHFDPTEVLPIPAVLADGAFYLMPTYLPIPPTFSFFAGGIQSGLMKNVLDRESELFEPLIEDSNKETVVRYTASSGIHSSAKKRFDDVNAKVLTSRFFLVTQPWHIPREKSDLSGFRDKGGQFDALDSDDETEETMLRRRTWGLWFFPKRPGAFLDGMRGFFGDSDDGFGGALDDVFSFVETMEGGISDIFFFMTSGNPLIKALQGMEFLNGFAGSSGSLIPTPPQWPAVRPDAYPGSVEMTDNEGGPDMMTGTARTKMSEYIDEQRNFMCRKAIPAFNDDNGDGNSSESCNEE